MFTVQTKNNASWFLPPPLEKIHHPKFQFNNSKAQIDDWISS